MKVFWRRGNERLTFTRPKTYFGIGQIGTGKSTLLEHIGVSHLEKGSCILDLFGSADGEGLGWLRSPYIKDRRVLLLKGENVDVETVHDVKMVENLGLNDLEKYDFIISARPLYLNKDYEFWSIGKLTDLIYRRLHWRKLIYLLAREAGNLWYSRLKVSEKQSDVKSEAIYMLREMRHLGCALGLDSLRFMSIDIDVRAHTDYLLLKAQGIDGFTSDLTWLYHFFAPAFVRSMKPWEFILVCRSGGLGVGHFPYHEWHKREKENIVKATGLKIEYGREVEPSKDMGLFKSVGDKEHMEIIELYAQGLGYQAIADKLGRSTRTPYEHVHRHNRAVKRSGFCAICKRAGGPYVNDAVTKTKKPSSEQEEG